MHDEGLEAVALGREGAVAEGVTYGDFDAGTARRAALADHVEHIGVLFSRARDDGRGGQERRYIVAGTMEG